MPLITSSRVSMLAIELLQRRLVLAGTIARVPDAELGGPSGGTVLIRVPSPRSARTQANPADQITYDPPAEVAVPVTVSHFYSGALIGDETLSLDVVDYGGQVLLPQVEAVAREAENTIADVMNGLDPDAELAWYGTADQADPDETAATVLGIREALTLNGAPADGRWCACSPDIATRLLAVPQFVESDKRGSTVALEAAEIGQLYGIRFVESAALDAGSSVAYHRSGLVLASAKPGDPGGGADSTTETAGGITLRHVLAYDPGHLATAAVTSVFAGCSVVAEDSNGDVIKRAIRVTINPAS